MLSLAGTGRAQSLPDPLALAVEPLLQSPSAELRGEAALVLAVTKSTRHYQALLHLAQDPDPAARWRAIVALGVLGQPGSDTLLGRILEHSSRNQTDRHLATLALGLLPDEPRVPAIDTFFNRVQAASRKRIHDELVCLLVGMRLAPHAIRTTVLERFLADATYRNRPVLALVIRCLAQSPCAETRVAFLRQLGSDDPDILEFALKALADPRVEFADSDIRRILRLAEHSKLPRVRAAALRLLTFLRRPESLELAGKGLRSDDRDAVLAAIHTVLALGGGSLRGSLERDILAVEDPGRQAVMMHGKAGPHGDLFVAASLGIARDTERPFPLRVAAIKIVTEAGWKDGGATATALFLAARDDESAASLARSIGRLGVPVDSTLLPHDTVEAMALFPLRLRALLRAGSSDAEKVLVAMLRKPGGTGLELEALHAYRSVRLALLDDVDRRLLPEPVTKLLE